MFCLPLASFVSLPRSGQQPDGESRAAADCSLHYSCSCDGPELGPYARRTIGAVPTGPVSHEIRVHIYSASEGNSPPNCSRVFRRHVPRRSSRSITFMSPPSPLFHNESTFQRSTAPNISLMANNCHWDGVADGQTRQGGRQKRRAGEGRRTRTALH